MIGNRTERNGGALLLYTSSNKKLSPIVKVPYNGPAKKAFPYRPTPVAPYCCSTYVSIAATCPDSCRFKRSEDGTPGGCYVDAGKTVFTIRRLDQESEQLSGDDVVVAEADLIDRAFRNGVPRDGARGGRDLRLHVGGDTSSEGATEFLAGAAARWRLRGGGSVWTFTHRWREIAKRAWGAISVLASVEKPQEMHEARARGYAPALVVTSHVSHKAHEVEGLKVIPCPAETRETTCVECRLCLDADALHRRGAVISFALHGAGSNRALVRLGHRGVQQRLL
jgi:hypothetical protein